MNACNFSVCIAFFNVRERKKKTSTEPSRTDTQTLFTPVSSRVAAAFALPASPLLLLLLLLALPLPLTKEKREGEKLSLLLPFAASISVLACVSERS